MSAAGELSKGLSVQSSEGDDILRLEGELDLSTVGHLRSAVEERLPVAGDLVLDMSELHFVDSTGLQEILNLAGRLSPGRIVVRRPSAIVRKLLHVTGLDNTQRITVEPNPPAAAG